MLGKTEKVRHSAIASPPTLQDEAELQEFEGLPKMQFAPNNEWSDVLQEEVGKPS